ncbi:MAG: hypothetical protein DMF84_11575 [Acidobacteria bacterium]|nr:MAG: hypothetical protein DMF84_11575 [Acidobacteriota bacterium]
MSQVEMARMTMTAMKVPDFDDDDVAPVAKILLGVGGLVWLLLRKDSFTASNYVTLAGATLVILLALPGMVRTLRKWRVRPFQVFVHRLRGYAAIKTGFSWPAFFLSGLWLLWMRLWRQTAAFWAVTIALRVVEIAVETAPDPVVQLAAQAVMVAAWLGLTLVPGVRGNRWRAQRLAARGYRLVGTIHASTPQAAIQEAAAGHLDEAVRVQP